jgi:threonine/homoserine/homoserine lactone efflux protein
VPVGDTATIVSSSLGIVTGDATITTQIASGVLQYLITPNSYPTTIQLSGTITVTYP